jgi:putative ABC transport system permease protein
MITVWQDIKYAFRMFHRKPGFTVVAVLILALGIGANTALFSLVQGVLLSPLPFDDPEHLVMVQKSILGHGPAGSCSGPDYLDWTEQNTVFDGLAALETEYRLNLTGQEEPVALNGARVSTNFFDTLGTHVALGRAFRSDESESDKLHVVVLSDRLWQDRFGADPEIIGKTITLDGANWTVVGVAPPMMGFIEEMIQLYIPLPMDELRKYRGGHYLGVIGRLKPEVSVQQAQAQLNVICEYLEQQYPQSNKNKRAHLDLLHAELVAGVRTAFLILYGAVGFLLLIACVNVSNLLLAKSGTRTREIAVRSALGAGRGRIFRQVLTESLLLALLGGVFGLLLGFWGLKGLKLVAPAVSPDTGGSIPGFDEISLNLMVLVFTVLVSMISGVLFGMVPAWHSCRFQIIEVLKQGGRSLSQGRSHHRALNTLVVTQVALALVLLTGAGLLIKSFSHLQQVNPGFVADKVLAVTLERPDNEKNRNLSERVAFYERVLDRISALPTVEFASAISRHPITSSTNDFDFDIKGRTFPVGQKPNAEYRQITPDYFKCMKIPLIKGRVFTRNDRGNESHVIIVSQELVRRYFQDTNPIGQVLRFNNDDKEIIGVVGNVIQTSLNSNRVRAFMYEPITQDCQRGMSLMIRTTGNPATLVRAVYQQIWKIDPSQPILRAATMVSIIANSMSVERFCTILLVVMGGIALLMAVVGLYSVMAFAVHERINEIGIRMALGARSVDILRLVTKHGLILTLFGLAAGLVGAFVLMRCLSGMLFQTNATDPLTYVIVALLLLSVSLLACYIPARRASRVDPMKVLRYE